MVAAAAPSPVAVSVPPVQPANPPAVPVLQTVLDRYKDDYVIPAMIDQSRNYYG